jgi:hypothetical protein
MEFRVFVAKLPGRQQDGQVEPEQEAVAAGQPIESAADRLE